MMKISISARIKKINSRAIFTSKEKIASQLIWKLNLQTKEKLIFSVSDVSLIKVTNCKWNEQQSKSNWQFRGQECNKMHTLKYDSYTNLSMELSDLTSKAPQALGYSLSTSIYILQRK